MNDSGRSIIQEDSLTSRLITFPLLDQHPPALRVSQIHWDSSFRETGLAVGDQIIAVNGVPIVKPNPDDLSSVLSKSVGQYAESQFWQKQGSKEGDPLTLTVRRRRIPGDGWTTLEFKGELRAERRYLSANEQWALAPGGPELTASDGFSGGWGGWCEQFIKHASGVLERAWQPTAFSSRYELERFVEHQARVEYLAEHYPGPLASALKADWLTARESLMGRKYEVSAEDLKYRTVEETEAQEVASASRELWEAFLKSKESETVAALPGVDPIRGDPSLIVGKYIALPPIGNRDWITEGVHNWFASGQGDAYYFIDAEASPAEKVLHAMRRYRKVVTPNIREEYTMLCRVLPATRLMVVNGRAVFGRHVEPIAALVGDAMFIDLTVEKNGVTPFAGEEKFMQLSAALPPADATPRQVFEAFVAALKEGDLTLWKQFFADWSVTELPDGRPMFHPYEPWITDNTWEDSRRRILSDVYGIEVVWTGDPRDVFGGHEFEGAPHIEEVVVEIDHIGSFDGEYRAFSKPSFNRFWLMQRVDGGPWRITSVQSI